MEEEEEDSISMKASVLAWIGIASIGAGIYLALGAAALFIYSGIWAFIVGAAINAEDD